MSKIPTHNREPDDGEPNPTGQSPNASPDSAADGSFDSPFHEPVVIPITGVLDLHSVPRRDAQAILEEYLQECYRQNLREIRVIHGRGIGVQREMVRKLLKQKDFVESFGDAPAEAGGWGATILTLRRKPAATGDRPHPDFR